MHNAHAQMILPSTPPTWQSTTEPTAQLSAETRTAHEQTTLSKTPPQSRPPQAINVHAHIIRPRTPPTGYNHAHRTAERSAHCA